MYKNFQTKYLSLALIVISIFHSSNGVQVGVYMSAHVRRKQDNTFETFNETISKNGRYMDLDLFITQKTGDNDLTIQYLDASGFKTNRQMHIVVCPTGTTLPDNLEAVNLPGLNCVVEKNSSMLFNIDQESIVQYQKGKTAQRYSYGGLKYCAGQISSELMQFPQNRFRFKNTIKNQLANLDKGEEMEERGKFMLKVKSLIDIDINYTLLQQIATNEQNDLFCKVNIKMQNDTKIESFVFRKMKQFNALIAFVDQQNGFENVTPVLEYDQPKPLLQKMIENAGLLYTEDLCTYEQSNQENNKTYQVQFKINSDSISALINEDLNKNLPVVITNPKQNMLQKGLNSVNPLKKSGFMKLSEFPKQDIQVQIMACSGFVYANPKGNILNQINITGCEFLRSVDGILTQQGNSSQDVITQRIQQAQTQNQAFTINDLPQQKLIFQHDTNSHSIEIKNFVEQCDLLYDTLLGVLFVLCYLQYHFQGNFLGIERLQGIAKQGRTELFTEKLTELKFDEPKLQDFKFEVNRNLSKNSVNKSRVLLRTVKEVYDNRKTNTDGFGECCAAYCECCCEIAYILIVYCFYGLCYLACKKCGDGRRMLLSEAMKTQIKAALTQGLNEYQDIIDNVREQGQLSSEQLTQILNEKQDFNQLRQKFGMFAETFSNLAQGQIPQNIQMDGETVDIQEEAHEMMALDEQIQKLLQKSDVSLATKNKILI